MRVVETTVYKFSELSDDAKEKARAWWRSQEYFANTHEEVRDTIAGFQKAFSCRVVEWEYSLCGHPSATVQAPRLDEEETVGEFIARTMPEKDCPFTGVCWDECALDLLRGKDLSGHTDLKYLLEQCILKLFVDAVKEMDWMMEDENVDISIISNDYEFTECGTFS